MPGPWARGVYPGRPSLKATKASHARIDFVSFVALGEGANIDEIKEPDRKLAQRNNVGKAHFRGVGVRFQWKSAIDL
jgi:hypothetical protein